MGVECARSSAHDGTTDRTAIPVKNISADEFSHFLWVFYDSCVTVTSIVCDSMAQSVVEPICMMHPHQSGVQFSCCLLQADGTLPRYMHSPCIS